jgi:hypothetical protein
VAAIRAGEANAKRRIYQLACGHEVSRRNRSGKRRAICGVCEAKCVVVGVKGQG